MQRGLPYPWPQQLSTCTNDLVTQELCGPLLYSGPAWHLWQKPFPINHHSAGCPPLHESGEVITLFFFFLVCLI